MTTDKYPPLPTPAHLEVNREDIIRISREAGFHASVGKMDKGGAYRPYVNAIGKDVPYEWVERFAVLVIAADRAARGVPDAMAQVAEKYAHKLALDLECVLADYSGKWWDTAMQTISGYRTEMNAIHERESPTWMGEPVIDDNTRTV